MAGCFVTLIGATLISAGAMHLAECHAQRTNSAPFQTPCTGRSPPWRRLAMARLFRSRARAAHCRGDDLHRSHHGGAAGRHCRDGLRRTDPPTGLCRDLGNGCECAAICRAQRRADRRHYAVDAGANCRGRPIIVRRGEPARSMYFIAAGEVEIALVQRQIRLGVGHFFGEIAVFQRARRSATVTATTAPACLPSMPMTFMR